jgi:predicted nucleotidyltransferase
MKLTDALDPVLGSPTKVRLLRTLLGSRSRTWTGRGVAGAARVSTAQAARDLRDLADVGVLLREVKGRSYSWRVNPDHILSEPLSALFHEEANLRAELVEQIAFCFGSAPIEHARLFGSFARGEERADSDVDLFVEVKNKADRSRVERAISQARARVWARFGNPVAAVVYTRAETRRPRNPALIEAVDRDGIEVR